MKKLFMGLVALCLFAAVGLASEGKIGKVRVDGQTGLTSMTLNLSGGGETNLVPLVAADADSMRALIANVLTAKASDATVYAFQRTVNGSSGWAIVIMQ